MYHELGGALAVGSDVAEIELNPLGSDTIIFTPYGAGAIERLGEKIRNAQAADPLAPVTVLTPSNLVGLHLRTRLVDSTADGPGLLNVRFIGFEQMVELLVDGQVPDQMKRMTAGHHVQAVRGALRSVDSPYRAVAHHPKTVAAVAAAVAKLRRAGTDAVESLRASRGHYLAEIYDAYRSRIEPRLLDGEDLVELAIHSLRGSNASKDELGRVFLFLPGRLGYRRRRLFKHLLEGDRATVLFGITGDPELDQEFSEWGVPPAYEQPRIAAGCLVAPDARSEVDLVLGEIGRLVETGVKLSRIAVLSASDAPYDALLEARFLRESSRLGAGIALHGRSLKRWKQTTAGRVLSGFLMLVERSLRRDAVIDWLQSAPLYFEGPLDGPAWSQVLRKASTQEGFESLCQALGRQLEGLRQHGKAEEASEVDRLNRFMTAVQLWATVPETKTWTSFAEWILGAFEFLDKKSLDESTRAELEILTHRIRGLSDLEIVDSPATWEEFAESVHELLDSPTPPETHFGQGVFRGRLEDAIGLDFDHVFILGMVDGVLPGREPDDPILPPRMLRHLDADLQLGATSQSNLRRAFLAARLSAPNVWFSTCRTDRARDRECSSSRWFLDEVSRLADGAPVYPGDLAHYANRPWMTYCTSTVSDARYGPPRTGLAYDLQPLLTGGEPEGTELWNDQAFRKGVLQTRLRASHAFSEADGFTGQNAWRESTGTLSASSLERLAKCPFQFFLHHVLRVDRAESEPDSEVMEPSERGSLIHEVLRRYAKHKMSHPDTTLEEDIARIVAIASEEISSVSSRGNRQQGILWAHATRRLVEEFKTFAEKDFELRVKYKSAPVAAEERVGYRDDGFEMLVSSIDGAEPISVRLNGTIDRIDAREGGGALVIDYKSGSDTSYRKLNEPPLLKFGELVQAPLYSNFVQAQFSGPILAIYWFFGTRNKWKVSELPLTAEVQTRFRANLAAMISATDLGTFVPRPGKIGSVPCEHCRHCKYEKVCVAERARDRSFGRKVGHPALTPLRQMWEATE